MSTGEESKRLRAGFRLDKCAVCGGHVEGYGLCSACMGHIRGLGGLEGLKQAVRAVRYLNSKE